MRHVALIFFVSLLFIQATCERLSNSSETTEAVKLAGTNWKLVATEVEGKRATAVANRGAKPGIRFDEDQLNGNTGCNNFFSPYLIKVDQLEISNLGTTKMACRTSEVVRQEDIVIGILRGTVQFEIKDEELILSKRNPNGKLYFQKM
ncbi:MAG: META domain-containing protein [Saprospiraceae bacterium]|nr:META domain-containing protein [Saprospiraceae bacterium]